MERGKIQTNLAIFAVIIIVFAIALLSTNSNLHGFVIYSENLGNNLVPNGDFSIGTVGGSPTYWTNTYRATVILSPETYETEPYSAKVSTISNRIGFLRSIFFSLESDSRYYASYSVRDLYPPYNEKVGMWIVCGFGENRRIVSKTTTLTNNQWKTVEFEFNTTGWNEVNNCYIRLDIGNAQGRVGESLFYDDVKIQEINENPLDLDNLFLIDDINHLRNDVLNGTDFQKQSYANLIYKAGLLLADLNINKPITIENGRIYTTNSYGILIKKDLRSFNDYLKQLSLAYLLTGNENYAIKAKELMLDLATIPDWGSEESIRRTNIGHNWDLISSNLIMGVSISSNWIRDYLTDAEYNQIKSKVINEANKKYQAILNNKNPYIRNKWGNHYLWNVASLGVVSYIYNGGLEDIRNYVKSEIDMALNECYPFDGSWPEGGLWYTGYGTYPLLVYLDARKKYDDENLFNKPWIRSLPDFIIYQLIPSDFSSRTLNLGDDVGRMLYQVPIIAKLSDELNNQYLSYLLNNEVEPGSSPFALIWYNPDIDQKSLDTLPKSHYFDDLGLIVIRNSWNLSSDYLAFKSGIPGGKLGNQLSFSNPQLTPGIGHSHPDQNSIIFFSGDEYQLADTGYTRLKMTKNHNTITFTKSGQEIGQEIEGGQWGQIPSNPNNGGEIKSFEINEEEGYYYVRADAAKAYTGLSVDKFERNLIYNPKLGYIVLFDDISSNADKINFYYYNPLGLIFNKGESKFRIGNLNLKVMPGLNNLSYTIENHSFVYVDGTNVSIGKHLKLTASTSNIQALSVFTKDSSNLEIKEIKNNDVLGLKIIKGNSLEIIAFNRKSSQVIIPLILDGNYIYLRNNNQGICSTTDYDGQKTAICISIPASGYKFVRLKKI